MILNDYMAPPYIEAATLERCLNQHRLLQATFDNIIVSYTHATPTIVPHEKRIIF